MTRRRKLLIAVAAVVVAGVAAVGIAQAIGGGGDDEQATGPDAERAERAAVAHVGGGRIVGIEREDTGEGDEGAWEVEIRRPDGTEIEVALDAHFRVIDAPLPRFSRPRAIENAHLPLSRFRRCELRGESEGERERVVRTLLPEAKRFTVAGRPVDAAVIEDRAFVSGELAERTLDYFAQADDGTVYYLGEDVDNYEDGRVADHEGSWLYGRDTQALGVAMPARPRVGSRWRFEDVPGVTRESNRVTRQLPSVRAGGREHRDVIEVRESIEPENEVELKLYARGVGVVRESPPDGRMELVGCR